MPPPAAQRVSSITVAFNPDPERLAAQIQALRGQVGEIILVDNSSDPPVGKLLGELAGPGLQLIALEENMGVAAGFNVGVRQARSRGAEFVLLLDHDSVPTPGMVDLLVAGYERCAALPAGASVAAVGPRINDLRDQREYPFIQMGWMSNRHVRCTGAEDDLVACDFLISSGSLIPVRSFATVGEFDEALFIDSVDLEWCCRARARHFALYGVCTARLDHQLGDERRVFLRAIKLVVHSPERIYYMTRNRLLLYQRAYMPLKWKVKDLLRFLAKFAATVLLVRPRRENARMTLWAIRDALAGRGGKCPRNVT
ncbi:MAG: glycosyltransferase family 2 protein [Usitatibacter sp.]